jgi:hypothetical protein
MPSNLCNICASSYGKHSNCPDLFSLSQRNQLLCAEIHASLRQQRGNPALLLPGVEEMAAECPPNGCGRAMPLVLPYSGTR